MNARSKILVVGAGVGGLSAAARLSKAGFQVEVIEKGAGPGGRCGSLQINGFRFDTGPTLLLMPEVLEEIFAAVGRNMTDYLTLQRCDPNYRLHFRDGSHMTFTTELTQMAKELERIEPGAFRRYLEFLALGRDQYKVSLERFVGRNFDSAWQMFSPSNLREVLRIRAHKKMYAEVGRYFSDDRLRAAMTFQTMYLGISPFEAPAVYGLLPFTELAVGIWFPKGGMYALPLALEKLCRDLGVQFRYRTSVSRIDADGGQVRGVSLQDGTRISADAVVCNADLPWAYKNLIDPKVSQLPREGKLKYTSSAFMMYWGTRKKYPGLLHHNVVFGANYQGAFDDIFTQLVVPNDPAFYVNAPAHTEPSMAPEGKDSIYVLVPVPNRQAKIDWKVEGPRVREKVLDRMADLGHADLRQNIEVEKHFTPDDYELTLNLERGSAFGLSHNFLQVGPFRPANVDPNIQGLFFVGASTQPGTGLPMVMLSAKLVTERVVESVPLRSARSTAEQGLPVLAL